jgi:hypothetical protein
MVMSPSKKRKRRSPRVLDAVALHVHPVDLPVGGREDALGEVMADEAVDAEDEDALHLAGSTSRSRSTPPSPQAAIPWPFSR